LKTKAQSPKPARRSPSVDGLSARALSTPEPFVRFFARRVQQEGALDLTQGDYKNADFAPHPEVVRAAQRITRNTVHSYGPAVGRMDVRSEVAEFFNRDGLLDYPDSEVRFLPDPGELDRLLGRGGISSVIVNNPQNPTGRV
jgi:aspartate/methionine/tyrosine aminotransferase